MIKGKTYRYAQPYTASINWPADSRLPKRMHMQISIEHIGRSAVLGVFSTNPSSIDLGTLRFEWDYVAFSDVGERFHVVFAVQLKDHGPSQECGFAVTDSGGNVGIWVTDGRFFEGSWAIGQRVLGPWTFSGDPTIYTSPFLIMRCTPVKYFEEP